ncbi:MAG: dephospho-CoA kinase [Aquificae bacterium]|nr:dephospho-CoA kinase [Aquificota bacterium]
MKRVGLTGNIGSGKSTVAHMFRKLGAWVLDADKLIHSFYRKGHKVYREVLELFGNEILTPEGEIDRRKLADIVFSDKGKLSELERITHGALYEEVEKTVSRLKDGDVFILEASLLVEKGSADRYDKLIVVYAPYELCKKRALARGMSEEDFERRWRLQLPPEEKVKRADFVIDNTKTLKETFEQVREVYEKLKEDP